MLDGPAPTTAQVLLSQAFVRHVLWKRATEAGEDVREAIAPLLLNATLERVIEHSWTWYSGLMFSRRRRQILATGDRLDVLAIDGNAKLHRRTCAVPFAEVMWCKALGKNLLRGCAHRPTGKDTLCKVHARVRDAGGMSQEADVTAIAEHRLKRALHFKGDFTHLEVKLEGFANRWQPACTVSADKLAAYFAKRAHERGMLRRARRLAFRAKKYSRKRLRKEASFMASWSSVGPKRCSECETHKESESHITAAARTAGFLTAVSASGVVLDICELIGAESLSQRYCFLANLAERWPDLKVVVHDDACHLRLMAESLAADSALAGRLAKDVAYVVDDFHASAHVGAWCKEHCLPSLSTNKALLGDFPAEICETVNSCLSPLSHTIHHMGRWVCQLVVSEIVDVHNMKVVMEKIAQRKREAAKQRKAAKSSQGPAAKMEAATAEQPEIRAKKARVLESMADP